MAQSNNQLVKSRVDPWPAYRFDIWLGLQLYGAAFGQFFFGLGDKLEVAELARVL